MPNARHHPAPREIDLHESPRVGGRVHAVVRRHVVGEAINRYYVFSTPAALAGDNLILDLRAMKETRHRPQEASPNGDARLTTPRIILWGISVSIVLTLALIGALHWRRGPTADTSDPYPTLPFHPRVTYDSSNVTISNTEEESYLDTSLNLYVGATLYSVRLGSVRPGESITCSLRSLTNERGESFIPGAPRTSELEVRARFGGYDVHKDFPPPHD
jgi:hypothetical protein